MITPTASTSQSRKRAIYLRNPSHRARHEGITA
jgi:hypothetical protein